MFFFLPKLNMFEQALYVFHLSIVFMLVACAFIVTFLYKQFNKIKKKNLNTNYEIMK